MFTELGYSRFGVRDLPTRLELLGINLRLQGHESVEERFGRWRATRNVNIDWHVAVDSLKHIVPFLEWTAGNRTRSHGDDIFWLGHLVVKAHNLGSHLLGDRPRHDHEVRLTR